MPGIKYDCPTCHSAHPQYTPCPRARPRRRADHRAQRPEWRKLYGKKWWRKTRLQILAAAPFCKCGEPATEVDHIIDHKGDKSKFYDRANLQPICRPCHSRKTQAAHPGANAGRWWRDTYSALLVAEPTCDCGARATMIAMPDDPHGPQPPPPDVAKLVTRCPDCQQQAGGEPLYEQVCDE